MDNTEQLIKEAAIEGANRNCISPRNAEGYIEGFTAGATYYRDELLRGEMERFAEWCGHNYFHVAGEIWNAGTSDKYTTSQLYDKFGEQELIKSKNSNDGNI